MLLSQTKLLIEKSIHIGKKGNAEAVDSVCIKFKKKINTYLSKVNNIVSNDLGF